MNIAEMHVWFRQYAQQMGMQNVRAILPEQIDVFINTAISDLVNQLIRENVGIRNDRVITDNSKIGQINALRSLYKVQELDLATATPFMEFLAENMLIGKMSNKWFNTITNNIEDVSTTVAPNYLYIVDFSINYKVANRGYSGSHGGQAPDVAPAVGKLNPSTNYFPVRLIEDAYLADTLNDFILKNRIRTPIIVTYNDGTFDLYIDEFKLDTDGTYYLVNKLIPFKLRFSYIASPAKVKYAKDIGGDNVDCDLPESMHIDILKHAVDLYNVALQGGLYSAQQNQQAQQREMSRNEARPTNEGYQN